jgi:hypothetical protein
VSESNIYDVNGISPTLMARDYKGPKLIAIKNATKKGYQIAELILLILLVKQEEGECKKTWRTQ